MAPTTAIGAPIVRKDTAERVVTAPVLVPDEPDRHRHQYRAENIREIAAKFLPNGEIDAMHAGGSVGYPTENYIAEKSAYFSEADRTVPAGSWIVSLKITDDEIWQGITNGTYRGVSVFGPIRSVHDSNGEELDMMDVTAPIGRANKRPPEPGQAEQPAPAPRPQPGQPAAANSAGATGIQREIRRAPVGETWTVEFKRATHVSIVDDPAVQAASFVAAKAVGGADADNADSQTNTNQQDNQITMDDELEEKLDGIKSVAEKSLETAQAAEEAAGQKAAVDEGQLRGLIEEVLSDMNAGDGGGGGGGGEENPDEQESSDGGDSGGGSAITASELADLIEDDVVDEDMLSALVEKGIIDSDALDKIDSISTSITLEKRLAAVEKALQSPGRKGAASQLDGVGAGKNNGRDISGDSITEGIRTAHGFGGSE